MTTTQAALRTLTAARVLVRERLAAAGIPNPLTNAERMLECLLDISRVELYLFRQQGLTESQQTQLDHWVQERVSGKPLQYLLGHTGFYGLDILVEKGVFIPRPETERLVEEVIRLVSESPVPSHPLRILDIGTGSGAIAVALAVNLSGAEVVATDVSEPALLLARKNATRNGIADRVHFALVDLFPATREAFDVIVSNPPYISSSTIPNLMPEVRDFEPHEALDGGPDGLNFHRRIIEGAKALLTPGGLVALEVGEGQAEMVAAIMQKTGYRDHRIEKDLCEVGRVVIARKGGHG
jgi:release factor glutamine methyltransferase